MASIIHTAENPFDPAAPYSAALSIVSETHVYHLDRRIVLGVKTWANVAAWQAGCLPVAERSVVIADAAYDAMIIANQTLFVGIADGLTHAAMSNDSVLGAGQFVPTES